MSVREIHPAFVAAAVQFRWYDRSLRKLRAHLDDAVEKVPGRWVCVVLPSGIRVAMRYRSGEVREVRIYRRERFASPEEESRWTAELVSARRDLGLHNWEVDHGFTPEGGPQAIFRECSVQEEAFV
jgi:hypothetical protein